MRVISVLLALLLAGGAAAQGVGRETNLPIPRYVSLKAKEANIRRGPGFDHRIDWIFQRRGMPLRVLAEYDVWRRVEDRDGEGGWIHSTLISGVRTVIVDAPTPMYVRPSERSRVLAEVEAGVVARFDGCSRDWCAIIAGDVDGWVPQGLLWGVIAP